MVRKLFILVIAAALLAACSSEVTPDTAVENYLQAIVEKDTAQVSALSCGGWEANAMMMLDSFQAVSAELQDLNCNEAGTTPEGMALVSCTGKIITSYGDELQELDLSVQDYVLENANGEWLVCGMQ